MQRFILITLVLLFSGGCGDGDIPITVIKNVEFCSEASDTKICQNPSKTFSTGTTKIYATYDVDIYDSNGTFTLIWTHLGNNEYAIASKTLSSTSKGTGRIYSHLTVDEGLAAGQYKLDISFKGKDSTGSTSASFTVQ